MIITPPSRSQYPRELPPRFDSADPREGAISEAGLFVELRPSAFVRPPVSLWCIIYLLLARYRGIPCTLWVPRHTDVKSCTMTTLWIFDLVQKRVLVSRDSARTIQPQLVAALADGLGELVLDLSDVDGLTPSFFDETLSNVEEALSARPQSRFRLTVKNPPTTLSNKFRRWGVCTALRSRSPRV